MGNCLEKETKTSDQPVEAKRSGDDGVQITAPERDKISEEVGSAIAPQGSVIERESNGMGLNILIVPEDQLQSGGELLPSTKLKMFPYNDLRTATQRFNRGNLLGVGGFGEVYKGWIDRYTMTAAKPREGLPIAVKKLRKERVHGHNEWMTELTFLCQFDHPNVVKLIGYCLQGEDRLLVYEYMARGSLESHLLREGNSPLNWRRRIKAALDSAKGLAYLHSLPNPVIHRDLKAANILLDSDFNAKLSDFGLAKFGPEGDKSHITTRLLGTRGHFAPEYVATGHLTFMTDVYSFGVVLLEIMSGSPAIKRYTDGMTGDLAQWAKPFLGNKIELHRLIDQKLHQKYRLRDACEFANITLRCLNLDSKSRPTMPEVVAALERLHQNMNNSNSTDLKTNTRVNKL